MKEMSQSWFSQERTRPTEDMKKKADKLENNLIQMCTETYKSLLQTTKRPCPIWIHGQFCLVLEFVQDRTQLKSFIKEVRICEAFIITTLVIFLINVYQNTPSVLVLKIKSVFNTLCRAHNMTFRTWINAGCLIADLE
jgi:hypothetical protein